MILAFYTPSGFDFSLKYEIESFLRSIEFVPLENGETQNLNLNEPKGKEASIREILLRFFDQYFSGTLISHQHFIDHLDIFERMQVKRSDFSQKVLKEVAQIPFGTIESYSSIAKKLGSKAYRAIGNILAANRFPILIPCHRVVPSPTIAKINDSINANTIQIIDNALVGGFMGENKKEGWSVSIKTQLLRFELSKSTQINNNV